MGFGASGWRGEIEGPYFVYLTNSDPHLDPIPSRLPFCLVLCTVPIKRIRPKGFVCKLFSAVP